MNLRQCVHVLAFVWLPVHHHDEPQIESVFDGEHPFGQRSVLDDHPVCVRVVKQVRDLIGRRGGVDGGDDPAGPEDGEVRLCPLHPSVGEQTDAVTGVDTQRPEPRREPPDDAVHPLVAEFGVPAVWSGVDHPRPDE